MNASMRRAGYAALLGAVALTASGCSQIAAIAPVSGSRLAMVRFATNDVLVSSKVVILVAPTCAESAKTIQCTGTTSDGSRITSTSDADHQDDISVTVGGTSLYNGPIADVINKAAQPTS